VTFQRKQPAAIGVKAPYPGFIEPALATSMDKVPSGERWIHEIKFDGYRVQVHLVNELAKVFTRRATIGPSVSGRSPTTPGTSAPARPSPGLGLQLACRAATLGRKPIHHLI
jgi:hypothetical protein